MDPSPTPESTENLTNSSSSTFSFSSPSVDAPPPASFDSADFSSQPPLSSPTSEEPRPASNSIIPNVSPLDSSLALRSLPAGLKLIVHFRAIGDAPILKKTKFQLSAVHKFSVIIEFLRKHLHSKPTDSLFLYCNSSFSPSPDAFIYDLYECFQLNKELVVNYAIQDAWG